MPTSLFLAKKITNTVEILFFFSPQLENYFFPQKVINQGTLLVDLLFGLYLSFLSRIRGAFTYFFIFYRDREISAAHITVNSTNAQIELGNL